jgi:natural product biosynthesis luciferase-like monooxygenase protein
MFHHSDEPRRRIVSAPLRFSLLGSGPQLIACAEYLLSHGHRVVAIGSDCPRVRAFSARAGLSCAPLAGDFRAYLAREPYDYLLSVVHHAIVGPELLSTAGVDAINYHDSLLPAHAGFNATSHALLEGRTRHGVTWHRMAAEVDRGDVLVQRSFEIGDEDTAFTLSLRCSEACIESFGELLAGLETGSLRPSAQHGEGSFHLRSERPGLALIDLAQPASVLQRLVRALDHGPDDNWMAKPKLWLGTGAVTVSEARLAGPATAAPGTVLQIEASGLRVMTADGALTLGDLRTLEGELLSAETLRDRFALREGSALPAFAALAAAAAFDAEVTRHERFWVQRLARSEAPRLGQLGVRDGDTSPEVRARAWTARGDDATLATVLAALVMRCGEGGAFDLGVQRDVPPELARFYCAVTPLHFEEDAATRTFAEVREEVASELREQARRKGVARDVRQRYAVLRERAQVPLPIVLRFDGREQNAEGAVLTLSVGAERHTWSFDPARVSAAWVERMIARFEVLLASALASPETPLAALPCLPADERTLLVERWQDTRVDYPRELCVHQAFAAQVERTPEAIALRHRDAALSYRELDRRANRVAHALRARGVGPDVLVGLCIERSVEMVIGLLAILKAGGAYVPLDPAYPRERIVMMLEDANAKVVLTQGSLAAQLPGPEKLVIETLLTDGADGAPDVDVRSSNLAYVIFTSGSTGRPKGVMVQHGNVLNFFAGMDRALGHEQPGRWLAVTSISFDISVLELFWTLARGFEVVLQGELDRASLAKAPTVSVAPMAFSLFYFAASTGGQAEAGTSTGGAYKLLLDGARFADTHDFTAVWTPERHFHEFGGLYPNPAVTTAALATITQRVQLRAGSIVLPLHNPLRVAEDWAVIDHLSGGRVGMSFASGWHVNDFAFMPHNYERRREVMLESIDTVRKLWRGEKVSVTNGAGKPIEVSVLPRPLNPNPPVWVASAGSVETFELAGRQGFNVLTNMLGQDLEDLRSKLRAYRDARRAAGHAGPGVVSVMLHTFVCEDTEKARTLARKPFSRYLASSFDLVKVAPWMFPAFKQPSKSAAQDPSFDPASFTDEDMEALLEHAFDRYFETAGLFGSPEHALGMVERLKGIGVDEVACLIDFGVDTDEALRGLTFLDKLRQLSNTPTAADDGLDYGVATQLARHQITHLQCTPSMARMLLSDTEARTALRGVKKLMLGGEALPRELADELRGLVGGEIVNMYGPTETTVWSTTSRVDASPITIGRPIANTVIRILDARGQLAPIGVAGELCIGGEGVVRGYLGRPDLTAERFVDDPVAPGTRIYRTGDLARYRDDGVIEFLGRLDHQVKISGYRIELGEIETAIARHPGVRQNVVVARSDRGTTELVAYVVAQPAAEAGDGARVAQWQSLWDETYKLASDQPGSARFNIAGWRDSFTGEPIPPPEMREWLDATLERIRAGAPQRVLELGCGTGMILYGTLPHVEHYTAVDLSPHALETIRSELSAQELSKVTLINQPAHELAGLAPRSFDTVIINSVAQYFPDGDYLHAVLARASELVADGGRIFVGDVRNLSHLRAFHTRAELTQAPATRTPQEIAARIERRMEREGELLLNEAWFRNLPGTLPRVADVDVQLKRGDAHNEMACFRFDVVLYVGAAPERFGLPSAGDLASQLSAVPAVAYARDVPNARLQANGVEPESLYCASPDYDAFVVQARSGDATRCDVVLRHRTRGPQGLPDWPAPAEAAACNQPARGSSGDELERELRELLAGSLPVYMIPAHFVTLPAFPLTPNQKIDRKALPPPTRAAVRAPKEQAPAKNDLEREIAGVWKGVLNIEQVGRDENIFELGANSLLTVQAANRLSTTLGRKVSLVSMFRFPSVSALAAHLSEAEAVRPAASAEPPRGDDRRKDAAERRRQLRAERAVRGGPND